jgi:hypothetical protein
MTRLGTSKFLNTMIAVRAWAASANIIWPTKAIVEKLRRSWSINKSTSTIWSRDSKKSLYQPFCETTIPHSPLYPLARHQTIYYSHTFFSHNIGSRFR